MRCYTALLALILSGTTVSSAETKPPRLETLLEGFSRISGLEARFHEEKRIAILATPLISDGTIHFAPPARLVRHTLEPERSTLLIMGNTLTIGDEMTVETIDLALSPVVRDYVDSFLKILEGDCVSLEKIWKMEMTANDSRWELTMHPISEAMVKTLDRISVKGHGVAIDWMKIVEATGDETITTFHDVNTERRYEEAEIDRLFRVLSR